MCFFRFRPLRHRLWAFAQMALARRPLARTEGIGFFKLMGAGTGEGFTPKPDTGAVVILTTWPDLATAERQTRDAPVFRRYRARADEVWTIHLTPRSAWGAWSRQMPFQPRGPVGDTAVVALTRATVRLPVLLKFWRRVPDIQRAIGGDANVIFKQGVGEVPWLHQMTFSIWPDTRAMAAFARADGPHARAIAAVRAGNWFAEELYARFSILKSEGSWGGRDPLERLSALQAAE
ncbi:spheroidene monooxygenase [Halovulum dunhuangense]|nr:spheroidene monooxygenase [Halovulum dunhuangense]